MSHDGDNVRLHLQVARMAESTAIMSLIWRHNGPLDAGQRSYPYSIRLLGYCLSSKTHTHDSQYYPCDGKRPQT